MRRVAAVRLPHPLLFTRPTPKIPFFSLCLPSQRKRLRKSKKRLAPGKAGFRFYRNIGLGFKTPREAIEGEGPGGGEPAASGRKGEKRTV